MSSSRPSLGRTRPSSAIFLGGEHLPDLPGPPLSPTGSEDELNGGRTLPSPPATNSASSDSTGKGSVRHRPSLPKQNMMLNGYDETFHSAFHAKPSEYEDNDFSHDPNTENHTAKLGSTHVRNPSENVLALQRVQSLTQRNKSALDKLSSIGRGSPSPSVISSSRASHSPMPQDRSTNERRSPLPPTSAASSSASSGSSSHQLSLNRRSLDYDSRDSLPTLSRRSPGVTPNQSTDYPSPKNRRTDLPHSHRDSGSETERGDLLNHAASDESLTPPPSVSNTRSNNSSHSSNTLSYNSNSSSARAHFPPSVYSSPSKVGSAYSANRALNDRNNVGAFDNRNQRLRRTSAPASPAKALSRSALNARDRDLSRDLNRAFTPDSFRSRDMASAAGPSRLSVRASSPSVRDSSPGPSQRGVSPMLTRTPRKRVSLAMSLQDYDERDDEDSDAEPGPRSESRIGRDVASAALAAVASSRMSPTSSRRTATTRRLSPNATGGSLKRTRQPLPTEFRNQDGDSRQVHSPENYRVPATPHRERRLSVGRASPSPRSKPPLLIDSRDARPTTQRPSTVRDLARRHQTRWVSEDMGSSPSMDGRDNERELGRPQTQRVGSAESVLTAGRTLVGEGLRAAGISKRRDDDVFSNDGRAEEPRSSRIDWSDRQIGAIVTSDTHRHNSYSSRPSTSMANFHHVDTRGDAPRTAPILRTSKSAYPLDRREEMARPSPNDLRDGAHTPFGTRRQIAPLKSHVTGSNTTSEHGKLMLEALSIFESNLSRLPPMGTTTTATIPELFRSTQHIVHASEKLNTLLRSGTNRALEEQIDAEVGDVENAGTDLVETWRRVGGEYRENLRVSDELVRTMTGFLLGVGKVLKDTSMVMEGTQSQLHARTMSLDEAPPRRISPEDRLGHELTNSGRRSTDMESRRSGESRRSWEPNPRSHGDTLRRANGVAPRPATSMNMLRDPPRTSTPGTAAGSGSVRRLFTPREQREFDKSPNPLMASLDSQETVHAYEPSPTPAPRREVPDRSRTLPPISIPAPLPSLPSEVTVRRNASERVGLAPREKERERGSHRKISTTSNATVRGGGGPMFSITTPNATTAVTPHTVSNASSPVAAFPLLRTTSDSSSKSGQSNVTFSRPSTVSVSALNGFQQLHGRKPTLSIVSLSDGESRPRGPVTPITRTPLTRSGSETERDPRRQTIGTRAGRVSLDAAATLQGDRTATIAPARRERRRTVTEIFTQG